MVHMVLAGASDDKTSSMNEKTTELFCPITHAKVHVVWRATLRLWHDTTVLNYCYPLASYVSQYVGNGSGSPGQWTPTQVPYNHGWPWRTHGVTTCERWPDVSPYWPRGPGMPSPDKHCGPHWPGIFERTASACRQETWHLHYEWWYSDGFLLWLALKNWRQYAAVSSLIRRLWTYLLACYLMRYFSTPRKHSKIYRSVEATLLLRRKWFQFSNPIQVDPQKAPILTSALISWQLESNSWQKLELHCQPYFAVRKLGKYGVATPHSCDFNWLRRSTGSRIHGSWF